MRVSFVYVSMVEQLAMQVMGQSLTFETCSRGTDLETKYMLLFLTCFLQTE